MNTYGDAYAARSLIRCGFAGERSFTMKRIFRLVVFTAALLLVTASSNAAEEKSDLDKLQGNWVAISGQADGNCELSNLLGYFAWSDTNSVLASRPGASCSSSRTSGQTSMNGSSRVRHCPFGSDFAGKSPKPPILPGRLLVHACLVRRLSQRFPDDNAVGGKMAESPWKLRPSTPPLRLACAIARK